MSEKDLYAKILKGVFSVPDHVSLDATNLLKKILILNPKYRMSVGEVIKLHIYHILNIILLSFIRLWNIIG